MIWLFLLLVGLGIVLFKLGAYSIWVSVLSLVIKLGFVVLFAAALMVGLTRLYSNYKKRNRVVGIE